MSRDRGNGSNTFLALILGVITGAAITLLSTPKSGKELREDLKVKADELPVEMKGLLSEMNETYKKLQKFLSDCVEGEACMLSEQKERVGKAFEKAKEKLKSSLKRVSKEGKDNEANGTDA